MKKLSPMLQTASNQEFLDHVIVPAHYQMAKNNSSRFAIKDNMERMIICSNDYAKQIGFADFEQVRFKRPDHDYQRHIGSAEHAHIQMDYLKEKKKSHNYAYKDSKTNIIYLTISEPVFNLAGEVIGKKDFDSQLQLVSHRQIIENHFKKHAVNVAALENIHNLVCLNEKEEVILFMLIAGYTQTEIANYLGVSRSYILKLISESLCQKFGLTLISTKLLIEKAISMGFASFIPQRFIETINDNVA